MKASNITVNKLVVQDFYDYNERRYKPNPDKSKLEAEYQERSRKLKAQLAKLPGDYEVNINPVQYYSYYKTFTDKQLMAKPYINLNIRVSDSQWAYSQSDIFSFLCDVFKHCLKDYKKTSFVYNTGNINIELIRKEQK
jgi:hypothetical protein